MSHQTIQSAQVRTSARHIVAGAMHARREVTRPSQSRFPFGEQWNFGIEIQSLSITIHPGIVYHAGTAYGLSAKKTLTDLADNDVVCLIFGFGDHSVDVGVREPYYDHDGEVIRALCRISVASGTARLDKWYGGGIEIGLVGA